MASPSLREDLAYVRAVAEEGAVAPSLSGRFALLWGILVTAALLIHWAGRAGALDIANNQIGTVWFGTFILGGLGSMILGRTMRGKPGASTAGNRTEMAIWPIAGGAIAVYAVAATYAVVARGAPVILYDTIMPMAFALYAMATAMSATLFRRRSSWWLVGVSILSAGACMALIGSPHTYLIAAGGVLVTQVIPAIAALRAEPKTVV